MNIRQFKALEPETKSRSSETGEATTARVGEATRLPAWTAAWRDRQPATLFPPHAGIQAKLTVSQPGDPYDQEADRVADHATRIPDANATMLQRASTDNAPVNGTPPILHEVLRSLGQPLDAKTRTFMEPRLGFDLGHVRIHTDRKAVESARAVSALAYTVGRDIVFGAGQYAPETAQGQRLLAHELAHVVQQEGGRSAVGPADLGVYRTTEPGSSISAAEVIAALDQPSFPGQNPIVERLLRLSDAALYHLLIEIDRQDVAPPPTGPQVELHRSHLDRIETLAASPGPTLSSASDRQRLMTAVERVKRRPRPPEPPVYEAVGSGYFPDPSLMEGGFTDMRGRPLRTLQDYLAGRASYVSVAMDLRAFPYGTRLRIRELEARYGQRIEFRVVDTGGAFRGKGTARMDICTANRAMSFDATINGPLHYTVEP